MVFEHLQGCCSLMRVTAINLTVQWSRRHQLRVLPELATHINDPDPLVRLAAINATCQMLTAFGTDLLLQYIPALAEATYQDPDTSVRSAAINARAMSAILLGNLLKHFPNTLSKWTESRIERCLLDCVMEEQNKPIIKILGNTISKLMPIDYITSFMLDRDESEDPRLLESALLIFAQLAQYVKLRSASDELHDVFMNCLENVSSADVRLAALIAVLNFHIHRWDFPFDIDRFQKLLPGMMRCLTEALNNGNDAMLQKALVSLIELAGTRPKFLKGQLLDGTDPRFFRWQLVDVIGSMLQIAEAENLEERTRHLAIEFVITWVEKMFIMKMRDLPPLILSRFFAILLKMLLDIEDETAWQLEENEDDDTGESSNYIFWKQCLHRLATVVCGNTIVLIVYAQLPAYLAAPEWQKHLAALVALAQIAKGRSKEIRNLEQVVTMVLNSIESHPDHPRVRWAAINAAGQLYAKLDPEYAHSDPEYLDPEYPEYAHLDPEYPHSDPEYPHSDPEYAHLDPEYPHSDPEYAHLDLDLQFEYHRPVLLALADVMRVDPNPCVRLAAINVTVQLFADLDPDLQFEYHTPVLLALADVMRVDPNPCVRSAAINVTVQLFADLDPELRHFVLDTLHGIICDREHLLVQDHAVSAMISISINYPLDTPRTLRVTVGTLLDEILELRRRRREDIASDQTRICAIRNILRVFEARLPHETWTLTFNHLHPYQRVEFLSIVAHR